MKTYDAIEAAGLGHQFSWVANGLEGKLDPESTASLILWILRQPREGFDLEARKEICQKLVEVK